METPNVINKLVDPTKNITFKIAAYRKLTQQEMIFAVRNYLSQKKKGKLKKGTIVTIYSIIGHND